MIRIATPRIIPDRLNHIAKNDAIPEAEQQLANLFGRVGVDPLCHLGRAVLDQIEETA